MAIKFNHQNTILALRDGFPEYFLKHRPIDVIWERDFAENAFKTAYSTGKRENEVLILPTTILIGTKILSVTFKENASGELTIEIEGKAIYTMKRDEQIGEHLLKAIAYSIKEGIHDEER
jgi:hypothetical protein